MSDLDEKTPLDIELIENIKKSIKLRIEKSKENIEYNIEDMINGHVNYTLNNDGRAISLEVKG